MSEFITTVAATLCFTFADAPKLCDLAGPITWCLRQADIQIRSQDDVIEDDTIVLDTDHGIVRVEMVEDGSYKDLSITVEASGMQGDLIARQVCFQLSRRISSRFETLSIVWQPTRQILRPGQFTWGALRDLPMKIAAESRGFHTTHYGASIC